MISCNVSKGAFAVHQTSESWNEKFLCDRTQQLHTRWQQTPSSEYSPDWHEVRHTIVTCLIFFKRYFKHGVYDSSFIPSLNFFVQNYTQSTSITAGTVLDISENKVLWLFLYIILRRATFFFFLWDTKRFYIIGSKWIVVWKPSCLYVLFYKLNFTWKLHLFPLFLVSLFCSFILSLK